MERISRAEIESSVDSFPDLDYKFEHINWADIMDAEEASNPEMKLEVLKEKSYDLRSELFRSTKTQPGLPSLNSLNLEESSRGLPPLDTSKGRGVNNGTVPTLVSFSGVLKKQNVKQPVYNIPVITGDPFKVPAVPKLMGKRSLEDAPRIPPAERKSVRPPPSPSSLHDTKRLKISDNCYNRGWKYGDDDFIFTSNFDWRSNRVESIRLPIPHSVSVSTLESDTEIETGSAFSDTSSTSTLTTKHPNRGEDLPIITDPHKLEQRQKQIDYGKNTDGYRNYVQLYPKINRRPNMPRTPDKHLGYSHRRWLGLITKWRKALHKWDGINTSILIPSSKEFQIEDANIFPTLPSEELLETSDVPQQTETYSDVLQGHLIVPPAPSEAYPCQDVPVNARYVSMREETPPEPITYASILKAPVLVSKDVAQFDTGDRDASSADKNGENMTQASAFTYSQALPAHIPAPLISAEVPYGSTRATDPSVEDPENSMEVEKSQKILIEPKNNIVQPVTYSQVLKSKLPVKQTSSDTIDTTQIEVINEQDNVCKEIEIPSKTDSSNPTYSQVLAGKRFENPDKNILMNGLNEDVALTNLTTPLHTPCDPTNTSNTPQNTVPL